MEAMVCLQMIYTDTYLNRDSPSQTVKYAKLPDGNFFHVQGQCWQLSCKSSQKLLVQIQMMLFCQSAVAGMSEALMASPTKKAAFRIKVQQKLVQGGSAFLFSHS